MATKVLTSRTELNSELQRLVDWADELHLAYAWVSTTNGRASHWRNLALEKVASAVVGVHFNQTEPYALRALAKRGALRVIADTAGVFHPKLLLGVNGDSGRALVGSSNFTSGGFGANVEMNVLLSGSMDTSPLADVSGFLSQLARHRLAFEPSDDWLDQYEEAWKARPRPPRTPAPPSKSGRTISSLESLEVGWDDYVSIIEDQERRILATGDPIHVFDHEDGSYLQEVEGCQDAFRRYGSLVEMPEGARRLVGGWGSESSGYFGRMTGAGYYKNLIMQRPEAVDTHLDRLPLSGAVSAEMGRRVLDGLVGLRGVSVGTASRLLTVKRPDVFVSSNGASRDALHAVFGTRAATVASYIGLHKSIWRLPWVGSTLPADATERRIWRARVALLDTIFYDTTKRPPGFDQ